MIDCTSQIAGALHHIHSRNILHRDLKTQNILLAGGGIVMLADFGISKVQLYMAIVGNCHLDLSVMTAESIRACAF